MGGRAGERERLVTSTSSSSSWSWSSTTLCGLLLFVLCLVTLAVMVFGGGAPPAVVSEAAPHRAEVMYVQKEEEQSPEVGQIWIAGLESSGTRWLADAVYRARYFGQKGVEKWGGEYPPCKGQVNHVSMPRGLNCESMRPKGNPKARPENWPLPPVKVIQPDMCAAVGGGRMQVNFTGVLEGDPSARVVFIVRPRKAQEAGVVKNQHCSIEAVLRAEGHQAEQLILEAHRHFPERTVMTHYEDFCWRRREVWEEIQRFLGLDAIDPDTFGQSFNLPGMTDNRPCELPD